MDEKVPAKVGDIAEQDYKREVYDPSDEHPSAHGHKIKEHVDAEVQVFLICCCAADEGHIGQRDNCQFIRPREGVPEKVTHDNVQEHRAEHNSNADDGDYLLDVESKPFETI